MSKILFETSRLSVRRLLDSDIDAFHDMQSNPKVMEFIKPAMTIEESQKELERFMGYYGNSELFFEIWAVLEKDSGEFVGICGVYTDETEEPQIAYRLRECFWGKGMGKEIATNLISYCFDSLGMEEIVAYVQSGNAGSIRILESLMTFEKEMYAERAAGMERKYRLRK